MASSFSVELTMSGMRRRSRSAPSMPTHTTPLVWLTMKAMAAGVILSAAAMRSPSFSRSSSSSTTTSSPAATAPSAACIESKPGVGSARSQSLVPMKAGEEVDEAAAAADLDRPASSEGRRPLPGLLLPPLLLLLLLLPAAVLKSRDRVPGPRRLPVFCAAGGAGSALHVYAASCMLPRM